MRVKNMTRAARLHRKALVLAIGLGFAGVSGLAFGQATTGTIFGQAPIAQGEVIQVTGGAGINRSVAVGPDGRYSVTLPVGVYTVTLKQNGKVVQTHTNVTPIAAGAVQVNFTASAAANAQNLSAITVSASAVPVIDVQSTTVKTTITAQQLDHLPLARNASAIAMLAPGVSFGQSADGVSPLGDPLLSFAGSSVVENAFYIDGMNTTDPLGNLGGITLPYNTIQQEQVLTAGYGAKYGRSAGGVINQIGKSGTNTWHFGGRLLWEPEKLRAAPDNQYFNNPFITTGNQAKGQLRRLRSDNRSWTTTYDMYVGGPIVKDKLFIYAAAEWNKTENDVVGVKTSHNVDEQQHKNPKYYVKVNWNITDSNILALTGIYNSHRYQGKTFAYNTDNQLRGAFQSIDQSTQNNFRVYVANYTSYITDNLTLHAMWGKMKGKYEVVQPGYPGYDPTLPHIYTAENQDPDKTPTGLAGVINSNLFGEIADPAHQSQVTSKRLDLDYRIGNHDIKVGMDNLITVNTHGGVVTTGQGFAWEYSHSTPGAPIQGSPFVPPPPPGSNGYVVDLRHFTDATSIKVRQRALYAQDNWQVTPRLILNIGLRRDQFVNYNAGGEPFITENKHQWGPRLGASWDVNGDSSLKVFANAGRYYLAVPTGPGLRGAGSSLYSRQYYAYDKIDANGIPHGVGGSGPNGLTPIGTTVFENNADGKPIDPNTVAAANVKAEYLDSFVLGAQKQLWGGGYVAGVTLRYNTMGRILDDYCDGREFKAAAKRAGIYDDVNMPGCVLINPGSTMVVRYAKKDGSGYDLVPISAKDMKFAKATRKYWSVELSLTHPWDGKWMGKIDYVLSHSYGNTEGGVQSNIGQAGNGSIDQSEQWDYPELMYYAGGDQANDRRHQLKAYGVFKIAPDWMLSGNLLIEQGTPVYCLGFFGPSGTADPVGYAAAQGGAYHYCGGVPTPPGTTGRTPWIHRLSLGIEWLPSQFDHKLTFQLQVQNVFNEQNATQLYSRFGQIPAAPNPTYRTPLFFENPRTVQLGVAYNF